MGEKLTKAQRPKLNARSLQWLDAINRHIRECDVRGSFDRFKDVAADPLDGHALRSDLDDLIRRGFLRVVRCDFDDSMGRDPHRDLSPDQCGSSWSVDPTPKLIRTFWPDRLDAITPAGRALLGEKK